MHAHADTEQYMSLMYNYEQQADAADDLLRRAIKCGGHNGHCASLYPKPKTSKGVPQCPCVESKC